MLNVLHWLQCCTHHGFVSVTCTPGGEAHEVQPDADDLNFAAGLTFAASGQDVRSQP